MPDWDSKDYCWAPISGKPSQGLFWAPAQSSPDSNTLAHHSSSACRDLSGTADISQGSAAISFCLVQHCMHMGKRA